MRDLTERQQTVIKLRKQNKTLAEIGTTFGITRERVRQILVGACGSSLSRTRFCAECGMDIGNIHPNCRFCPVCSRLRKSLAMRRYLQSPKGMEAQRKYYKTAGYAEMMIRYWQKQLGKRRNGDNEEVK